MIPAEEQSPISSTDGNSHADGFKKEHFVAHSVKRGKVRLDKICCLVSSRKELLYADGSVMLLLRIPLQRSSEKITKMGQPPACGECTCSDQHRFSPSKRLQPTRVALACLLKKTFLFRLLKRPCQGCLARDFHRVVVLPLCQRQYRTSQSEGLQLARPFWIKSCKP